jgi:ParB family chromosome partitioning protein
MGNTSFLLLSPYAMNLNACPRALQISLIDFTDFSYAISPERDIILDETFIKSIAKHGILHPPIIRKTDSGSHVIVTGRKRLLAFRSLFPAARTCCFLVIPPKVPEIDVYSVLLEDIRIARQLTPVEKALLLKKISALADVEHIVSEFLPRMDLSPDPFHIRQSLKLLALEEPIIHAIHRGMVHETVARDITSLSSTDRMALFHLITSLRLSISYQKKLVTICRDIAGREGISIAEVLENPEAVSILNHPGTNPPQKTKNLMTWLTRKHAPRSSQAEAEFTGFVAEMQLPGKATIQHTPSFEDEAVTLSISFSNRKSLQETWEKIKNALYEIDA